MPNSRWKAFNRSFSDIARRSWPVCRCYSSKTAAAWLRVNFELGAIVCGIDLWFAAGNKSKASPEKRHVALRATAMNDFFVM